MCFSVNFAKFLRTPFLQKTTGWLLLKKTWKLVLFPSLLQLLFYASLSLFSCKLLFHDILQEMLLVWNVYQSEFFDDMELSLSPNFSSDITNLSKLSNIYSP